MTQFPHRRYGCVCSLPSAIRMAHRRASRLPPSSIGSPGSRRPQQSRFEAKRLPAHGHARVRVFPLVRANWAQLSAVPAVLPTRPLAC
eukprot:11216154-Lingulodinium_polyedra.AAC.1